MSKTLLSVQALAGDKLAAAVAAQHEVMSATAAALLSGDVSIFGATASLLTKKTRTCVAVRQALTCAESVLRAHWSETTLPVLSAEEQPMLDAMARALTIGELRAPCLRGVAGKRTEAQREAVAPFAGAMAQAWNDAVTARVDGMALAAKQAREAGKAVRDATAAALAAAAGKSSQASNTTTTTTAEPSPLESSKPAALTLADAVAMLARADAGDLDALDASQLDALRAAGAAAAVMVEARAARAAAAAAQAAEKIAADAAHAASLETAMSTTVQGEDTRHAPLSIVAQQPAHQPAHQPAPKTGKGKRKDAERIAA